MSLLLHAIQILASDCMNTIKSKITRQQFTQGEIFCCSKIILTLQEIVDSKSIDVYSIVTKEQYMVYLY
jgi:hypothetical protein